MKKKLTEIFKEECTTEMNLDEAHKYDWYFDEQNKPIGISKEVSRTTRELVDLHYVRIGVSTLADVEKLLWLNFLTEQKSSAQISLKEFDLTPIKFIFFFHHLDTDLQLEFEHLVQGFNEHFLVCFLESKYGVILNLSADEKGSDDEIKDFLLASKQDFSSQLTFYQTIGYQVDKYLPKKFEKEFQMFQKLKDPHVDLMDYKDMFLNYSMSLELVEEHTVLREWFKPIFSIDAELLAVMKCYLETGFNVTMGAKMMHMHRNTFMNKLDKFIEITGLDVKNFDEALIAYLSLRLRRDV